MIHTCYAFPIEKTSFLLFSNYLLMCFISNLYGFSPKIFANFCHAKNISTICTCVECGLQRCNSVILCLLKNKPRNYVENFEGLEGYLILWFTVCKSPCIKVFFLFISGVAFLLTHFHNKTLHINI